MVNESRRWLLLGVAYLFLAALFYVAPDSNLLLSVAKRMRSWLWVFGPPALLLHQRGSELPFLIASLSVAIGIAATRGLWARLPVAAVCAGGCALIAWLLSGLFVYVASW